MPTITFDSCIFIAHQPSYYPKGFCMTAVVLEELTAGSSDDGEGRRWQQVRKDREKDGTLFTPNAEDWWMAGKILNSLRRGLKSAKTGKIPKHSASHRENLYLVTDNIKDFETINNYCKIKLISGKDFFGTN